MKWILDCIVMGVVVVIITVWEKWDFFKVWVAGNKQHYNYRG